MWYGPDTYMGENLAMLFMFLAQMSDDEVRAIHPGEHCILAQHQSFLG